MYNIKSDENGAIHSVEVPPMSFIAYLKKKEVRSNIIFCLFITLICIFFKPSTIWAIVIKLLLIGCPIYYWYLGYYYILPYRISFYEEKIILDFHMFGLQWSRSFLYKDVRFHCSTLTQAIKIQKLNCLLGRIGGIGYIFYPWNSNWDHNSINQLIEYAKSHTSVNYYER